MKTTVLRARTRRLDACSPHRLDSGVWRRSEQQAQCTVCSTGPSRSDPSLGSGVQLYRLDLCWTPHGVSGKGEGAERRLQDKVHLAITRHQPQLIRVRCAWPSLAWPGTRLKSNLRLRAATYTPYCFSRLHGSLSGLASCTAEHNTQKKRYRYLCFFTSQQSSQASRHGVHHAPEHGRQPERRSAESLHPDEVGGEPKDQVARETQIGVMDIGRWLLATV